MAGGVDAGYLHGASPCPWTQPARPTCCLVTRLPSVVPRVLKGRHGQRPLVRAQTPGTNSPAILLFWHSRFACCLHHQCLATKPRAEETDLGTWAGPVSGSRELRSPIRTVLRPVIFCSGWILPGPPTPPPTPHPHRSGELQQAGCRCHCCHSREQTNPESALGRWLTSSDAVHSAGIIIVV